MRIFRNSKVATKLWLMVIPTVIMTIFFIGQLYYQSNTISNITKKTYYDEVYVNTRLIMNAERAFYQAAIAEESIVLSESSLDQDTKDKLLQEYTFKKDKVLEEIDKAMANLESNPNFLDFKFSGPKYNIYDLNDIFHSNFADWENAYNPETGEGDFTAKEEAFEYASDYLTYMTNILEEYSIYITDDIQNSVSSAVFHSAIFIIILFLLIFSLAIFIVRYLRKNILKLTEDMNKLANNDLSFEPHIIEGKDELANLSKSVSTVIYSLREVIKSLSQSTNSLSNSSQAMTTNSSDVSESMNGISNIISDIADGASQQSEDSRLLMNEISNLEEVVAQGTSSANELSKASLEIKAASEDGLKSVNQLEEITLKNENSFQSIFNSIDVTHVNASKISEASSLISEIVQETKLLSLNATIEAARAGETGKGFAVVAGEIGRLSRQSENSIQMIQTILEELQDNINNINAQSSIVKEVVLNQTASVNDTKEKYLAIVRSLNNINTEISNLNSVIQNIENSRVIVSDIGLRVSEVSEDYAVSTEETSTTSEEVLEAMLSIDKIGKELGNFVVELKELINKFELEVQPSNDNHKVMANQTLKNERKQKKGKIKSKKIKKIKK